jgi:putative peptide zinc metalloprotease protein
VPGLRDGTPVTGPAARVAGRSRVRLRRLSARRDRDGWVIGRTETGDFISVPDVAHRVLALLGEDRCVDDVADRLRAETGTSFAVADFVAALDDLGFVEAIDDAARSDTAHLRASLPWLQPRHVRWLTRPVAPAVAAGFAVATVVVLALHPALLPSYRVLVWSSRPGLVLAVNAAIAWTLILTHELAHLATARSVGVPARITLGTRLQFLAAQTDVSGVWAAPRRQRMTVYLAGMSMDVCCAGTCLLVLQLDDPHGLARELLAVAVTEIFLGLALQFMVFMRTDVYFALQDLTGCADLYSEGSAYLRHIRSRCARRSSTDPTGGHLLRRGRAVRLYAIVLLAGTAVCLGIEFAVSLPALITLAARAVSETGTTPAATIDGSAALAILLGFQILWASRWWHRHRHQVRHYLATRRKEVTRHDRHCPQARRPARSPSQRHTHKHRHPADRHPQARPARDHAILLLRQRIGARCWADRNRRPGTSHCFPQVAGRQTRGFGSPYS